MTYVLTAPEMQAADAAATARVGEDALMQRAGAAVAGAIREFFPDGARVIALAGPGNNGGDAFAALAQLEPRYDRTVYAAASRTPSPARAQAERRAREAGVRVEPFPENDAAVRGALGEGGVAVDALFGTGARLPLPEAFRAAARGLDGRSRFVLAVDVASGIDASNGAVAPDCVYATVTLALGAIKAGSLLDAARAHSGIVRCARIGIEDSELAAHDRTFTALDDRELRALLPVRSGSVDKRGAGTPLVVAGSRQFPGAAVLCAKSAARAGAGYVTLVAPESIAAELRAHLIEQVVVTYDEASGARAVADAILETSSHNSAIAIGPGLGLDERTGEIVRAVVAGSKLPIVADASALYHFAKHLDVLRGKPLIVTPHEGEFARLSGGGTIAPGERVARLRDFVDRTGVTTLLKGPGTLIYGGGLIAINTSGTDALATAGSGDVLTGIVATLLSQGLAPFDAGRAAAYWHGLAGQSAARRRPVGVIAGDLIDVLAEALPAR